MMRNDDIWAVRREVSWKEERVESEGVMMLVEQSKQGQLLLSTLNFSTYLLSLLMQSPSSLKWQ